MARRRGKSEMKSFNKWTLPNDPSILQNTAALFKSIDANSSKYGISCCRIDGISEHRPKEFDNNKIMHTKEFEVNKRGYKDRFLLITAMTDEGVDMTWNEMKKKLNYFNNKLGPQGLNLFTDINI